MLRRFAFAVLAVSFAAITAAQQAPTSYPDDTQSPNQSSGSVDCSDPLMAGSVQCSNQSGQTPGLSAPSLGGQTPTQIPGSYPGQSRGGLSQTYSDAESQTRRSAAEGKSQQVPLPAEPLTEFQKFVASTTGQILPLFGANLFHTVPSTFAPLDMTPVPPDYIIGPGDELRIKVWGQVNFQANVRVDRSGEIYIPVSQVGPVHVAGLHYSELYSHLHDAIGRVYRSFDLIADIGRIRAIQVYVAGEARRAGVYTVSSLSTLIDALFASGGPSVQGSLRHVQLRRGTDTITDFDLYSFLIRGDKSKDIKLESGDVIFIPPVGPQAAVLGSVRNPGIYELREKEPLSDLIGDAGGTSATAAQARISIERIQAHSDRQAMEVAYDATGLATPVREGDLVRVFPIVPRYSQTVTLRGNIANPGRFGWHPGMHVSDLIPDKESLVTRNYWWRRAQLGLPAPEFEPMPGLANAKQPADGQPITMPRPVQSQNGLLQPELRPGSTQMPESMQSQQVGTQMGTQPGEQSPLSPSLSAQQGSNSSLAAQQTQSYRQGAQPERTDVYLPAPEIDWEYADILRMDQATLKTSIIPFDLGKLVIEHDSSQDLELQPGDVVSIFSEADIHLPIAHQTKFVRLEGEVEHAGLYTAKPGETLRDLVSRAGGLTPNAYLYGAEFTRESTRALQQARINEYLQSLDLRMQRSNLAISASAVSSPQDLASGAAAQSSERELLNRLRQMRASGRVVLEFLPTSQGIGDIPAVALEDGDRLIIPPVPATVNVVGAVNDQNSFLYARHRSVGDYLKKAGGLTKDADRRRAFLIRASGEVVGYSAPTLWTSSFDSLKIYPGDTIVVPEKTFRPSALRGVLDWSQMFSQFALGAAAISVIR
jgi:protein involved in polysaccharide export with SLBB domain